MYETLRIDREEHLTWCTLNRPDALNAMSRTLIREVRDFFWRLPEDRETRVVVLRGAGRAFCAGLDLKEHAASPDVAQDAGSVQGTLRGQREVSEIVMLMRRAPQPIIAAVHGAACGGGFAMALAADVRIAAASARMNAAFIRLGLSACDVGVSYFLPRLVGGSLAAELLLTGNFVDAARAERIGLVSRVVPDDRPRRGSPCARGRHAAQLAARSASHEGMPQARAGRRQPRGGGGDGGSQSGARGPHGGFPRRRHGVPPEAAGGVPGLLSAGQTVGVLDERAVARRAGWDYGFGR